jgi:tight adherence protein B
MKFLTNEWILIPLFSACLILVVYLWYDRVLGILHKRSLGQREEIIRILELMFIEVNRPKITLTLLLFSFGLGLCTLLIFWPNIVAGLVFGAIITLVGFSIPLPIIKSLHQKRKGRFVDQMIDGLTIMGNGIKSGLSITQCMERVVQNMPNPIAQEFELVLAQIRLGRTVEEALIELGERVDKPDVQMFVTAINILKETGGNLAETFATIVTTIRERQKIEKKIEAMTAQGMMQGLIVSLVPIGILVMFLVVDPPYIMPMFTTTLGLIILFFTFALIFIGGMTILKIVKVKV